MGVGEKECVLFIAVSPRPSIPLSIGFLNEILNGCKDKGTNKRCRKYNNVS
jgi:hypothetical protein